jgi:hypothetical protein
VFRALNLLLNRDSQCPVHECSVLNFLFLQIYTADLTQLFFFCKLTQLFTWTCARCGDMIEVNLHYCWSAS